MADYLPRVVDAELDELMAGLAAISIEGPKGVGKTVTAARRAETIISLEQSRGEDLVAIDASDLDTAPYPILIDEWQRYPPVWDLVRSSVDRDLTPGRFLLTGSAVPTGATIHSGAGRIVTVRMRPMSLAERGLETPTVSLLDLLSGERPSIDGTSTVGFPTYVDEILRSGFPGIRPLPPRARRAQLAGYVDRVVAREFAEQGHPVRRPAALRGWLTAYAAAISTTASYNAILDAATPGEADKPARPTTIAYREVLEQLWLLDPVPGWVPGHNAFKRLAQMPKHQLADPALTARLLGVDALGLRSGQRALGEHLRDGPLLGALFESLVTLSVRVYAQAAEARVHHLRTRNGDHEIDLIVEGADRRVVALEVKLSQSADSKAAVDLNWLSERLGDQLADAAIITTGRKAFRRRDGIAVIPASLLGP